LKLVLHDNIQFIYELALAKMELDTLAVHYVMEQNLRAFEAKDHPDAEKLKRRTAYFKAVDGMLTDYHFIQQFNRTSSVNQYLTHWIYPYKGKFHPQMIRALINVCEVGEGETVLDPFVGSGTTPVEAMLLGVNCIGIDTSPLCVLQSRVKTESTEVFDRIVELGTAVMPEVPAGEQLALPIDHYVDDIPEERVRNFFKMAELVAHSDVARRHRDFMKSYVFALRRMTESVRDLRDVSRQLRLTLGKVHIRQGDARRLDLPSESVDCIITSPPYSIALNYVEQDSHALKALGYDLERIKDEFIGVRGKGMERFRLYNRDMAGCYAEMFRVLKAGRPCAVVIGNVVMQGEEVNTTKVAIGQCRDAGFEHLASIDKIIHGLYNVMQREYILLFRKPGRQPCSKTWMSTPAGSKTLSRD
jgi:DNA modification methylase